MIRTNQHAPYSKAFRNAALPALIAIALAVLAYELNGFASVHSTLADFRAFWCAGSAVLHGADPYATASISACEHAPMPLNFYTAPAGVVVPAPLPPYVLVVFAAFALLPYPLAAAAWLAATAAALIFAVRTLIGVLGIPSSAAVCMLLLPATVLWLPFGEATPIALFGAAAAARGLQQNRYGFAAIGLALLAVEPHVAIGAWTCAALFVKRVRVPLVVCGVILVALSVLAYPSALAEYLLRVLPLHALAEVPRPVQYSATWLLNALGASPAFALRAGACTYVAALAIGIVLAVRLHQKWNDPAVLAFVPMATVLLGGTFVHASQIALALPFATMIAVRERRRTGALCAVACGALAVPWLQGGAQQTIVLLGVAVSTAVVYTLRADQRLAMRSMAAWSALAALLVLAHRVPPAAQHSQAFPITQSTREYASAAWGRYIWREQSTVTLADWLGKAPAWVALLLLVGSAAGIAAHKEPVLVVRVDEAPALP